MEENEVVYTLDTDLSNYKCYACGEKLRYQHRNDSGDYQFDNNLWLTFDGGYGMFIESDSFMMMHDFWDTLGEDRQRALHEEVTLEACKRIGIKYDPDTQIHDVGIPMMPMPDSVREEFHAYVEKNRKHRVNICHECAHDLCSKVPWIEKLLDSHSSHSHRTSYVDANPDHYGWDYDYREGVAR